MLVVLGATDLVSRLTAELHDVEGVEAHLRVREASGARIAFSYPADMSIETALIETFCSALS